MATKLIPLTALELLADRSVTAGNAERACRDRAETRAERDVHHHASYLNGQDIAYIDARKIMEAELRRLCNKFQNGNLSIDDFGIVL